ncbi:hypothetical protein ASZ90_019311 [hydrocarbon metagenome]|uniref:DUF1659 domain-containing protein n=1 Tax=hydrocarbon metagenome TaxID=938273 RepID=A0A0W8E3I4_9ZZZZ
MAVTSIPVTSEMVLVMDNGIGASGQQLKKNRVYKYVKTAANSEDVFSVAQSLLDLQEKTNLSIQRNDSSELEEE